MPLMMASFLRNILRGTLASLASTILAICNMFVTKRKTI